MQCGKALGESAELGTPSRRRTPSPQYEVCEISDYLVKTGGTFTAARSEFKAKSVGVSGLTVVARSEYRHGDPSSREGREALDELIKILIADGWEFVGRYGSKEHQLRFRRGS
jgi:hypothetical protein